MKHIAISLFVAAALAACSSGTSGSTTGGTTAAGTTTGHATGGAGSTTGAASTTGAGSTTGSHSSGSSSAGSTGAGASSGGAGTTGAGSTTGAGASSGGVGTTGAGTGGLASVLLVDNDGVPGSGNPDPSLTLAQGWLTAAGIPFDVYQEPNDGSDPSDVDPQDSQLTGINTIVWITGDNNGDGDPTVSSTQQTLLQAWLDEGGKTLVLLAPALPDDFGVDSWTSPETNTFLTSYVGLQNDLYDPLWANVVTTTEPDLASTASFTATGSSGASAFAGRTWTVVNNDDTNGSPYVRFRTSIVNPAAGTDVLATVMADPTSSGTNAAVPVATGNKAAGKLGTSTVVFVGLTVENLSNLIPSQNVQCDFLTAIQTYAGMGGTAGNCGVTVPTGTATAPTLLVDSDYESTDVSLPVFQSWLTGLGGAYTTYTPPQGAPYDFNDVDPSAPSLAGLSTIVWITGENDGDDTPTIGWGQQALLDAWLDEGGKTLVLFAAGAGDDFAQDSWSSNEPNWFLSNYAGFLADVQDPSVVVSGGDVDIDSQTSNVVTGSSVSGFNGLSWNVTMSENLQLNYFTIVNPLPSNVDVLATVQVDPTNSGTANTAEPIVIGHKQVGAAGTSTVVYVGFEVENIQSLPGTATQAQFLQAIAAYAAVP